MRQFSRWISLGGCLVLLVLANNTGCTKRAACEGEVGQFTLDPNGGSCTKACECNNLKYTGVCGNVDGARACVSITRSACTAPGEIGPCIHHFTQCAGTRICSPTELGGRAFWGDCKCASTEEKASEKTAPQEPTNEATNEETITAELTNEGTKEPPPEPAEPAEEPSLPTDGGLEPSIELTNENLPDEQVTEPVSPERPEDREAGDGDAPCQPGSNRICYTGPTGTAGVGSCKTGQQYCEVGGRWGDCQGELKPKDETCDGLDNDCDGRADEGCFMPHIGTEAAGKTEGPENIARLVLPLRPGLAPNGDLYVASSDDATRTKRITRIHQVNKGTCGSQTNYTGPCSSKYAGGKDQNGDLVTNRDGPADEAAFRSPGPLSIDTTGDIYLINHNMLRRIFKVTNGPCGTNSNYTGVCVESYAGQAYPPNNPPAVTFKDGALADAYFRNPQGIAFDKKGDIYIADRDNHCIRKIDKAQKRVSTFAGQCTKSGNTDNTTLFNARFNAPFDLVFDAAGNLYVSEELGARIRKIDPGANRVTTLAGTGTPSTPFDGTGTSAKFSAPKDIDIDHKRNRLYLLDLTTYVRSVDLATGKTTTLLHTTIDTKNRSYGRIGKDPIQTDHFGGLAYDQNGTLYVSERRHAIRKLVIP